MLPDFLLIFTSLYLAQMGDKTQILTLLLASRTKRHVLLFAAVMSGFFIGVVLAILFGSSLSILIPHKYLKVISGAIFVILGVLLVRKSLQKQKKIRVARPHHLFLSTMLLIFLTDFGDKTQLAIALFSSNYSALIVFFAAIAALALDTFLMIFFSKLILHRIKESVIEKIAAISFIIIGTLLTFVF